MVKKVITALIMGLIIAGVGIFILKDIKIASICGLMMFMFVFMPKKNR